MYFLVYFCSFVSFAINAIDSGTPSDIMIITDHKPKPYSIDGISQFDIFNISSYEHYEVETYFKSPMNIYDKTIYGYYYTVYQYKNATHLDMVPFKNSTFLPKNTTNFVIKSLQYNKAYYAVMFVYYKGEPLNYAYAGIKHFQYLGNKASGKFIKSDNYRFAPVFGDANVKINQNNTYDIRTRWHKIKYPRYKRFIKTFVIEIKRVDVDGYHVAQPISYSGDILEHTFTSVPAHAEYQVSIYAIPKGDTVLWDYLSSRQFFDLH